MSDNPFDNIEEFTSPAAPSRPAKRKASPAAAQAAAKRRKPSPDRYRNASAHPAAASYQAPQGAGKKGKKNKRNTMSAEAMMQQKAQGKPRNDAGVLRRIVFFFRSNSPLEIWMTFLSWVSRHPYAILLAAVAFIAAGMLFSRYISVAGAIAFIALGALLSKEDFDTAGYFCYAAAFADFIIPYLI